MANAEQIRFWNEVSPARWTLMRAQLSRALEPFGRIAMDAVAPRPGDLPLDVGCGFGETTVELARRCGAAVGVDVSEPFLAIARAEAPPNVRFLRADVQTHDFEERFDVVYSRFGIMFFEDPAAAFANLHRSMRSGARFGAVVWGPPERNEWAQLPLQVLRRHRPAKDPGTGPGPFGLADAAALEGFLRGARFADVSVRPLEHPYEASAELLVRSGPASAALREAGAEGERLLPIVEAELRAEAPPLLRASVLVVTARA